MSTNLSFPANLRFDPHPNGNFARHFAGPPQQQLDAAPRGTMTEQLTALCGRPARVLDLAMLAPGGRVLDAVEPDAYDLIRGARLEALVGAHGADAGCLRELGEGLEPG